MSQDLETTIRMRADASGVEAGVSKAKKSLSDLGRAATDAGKAAADGVGSIGDKVDQSAKKTDRATKSISDSIQRQIAMFEAGEKGSRSYIEALAKLRGADVSKLGPLLDQLEGVRKKQDELRRSALDATQAQTQLAASARQSTYQLRQVAPQITDVVTQLAAGQAPLQILIQQGGQLKDVFGGVGPALRAVGGYVLGLINPFTVAAAVLGVMAFAALQGGKELRGFETAITLSGNAAGKSSSDFAILRDALAGVAGTKGRAAEALTAVASNGRIAADSFAQVAAAATLMERATGKALKATVDEFASLQDEPLKAAVKLNEQYNFLTLATYKQIKAFQDHGRESDAAKVATDALATATKDRATAILENVGLIERAWRGVVSVIKQAADATLNVGRGQTVAERLAVVQGQIAKARQPFDASPFGGNAEARAKLQDNLALEKSLIRQLEIEQGYAVAAGVSAAQVKARAEFDKAGEQFLTKRQQMEREIARATEQGKEAGASEAELQKRILAIREKYNETVGQGGIAAQRAAKRVADEELKRLQSSISSLDFSKPTKLTDAERRVIQVEEQLKESVLGVARARLVQELQEARNAVQSEQNVALTERQFAAVKKATEAYQQLIVDTSKAADAINQQAAEQEAANANFGKSKTAIEQLVLAQLKLQATEADASDSFDPRYVAGLNAKVAAQERYVKALQQAEYQQKNLQLNEAGRIAAETQQSLELELSLLGKTREQRELVISQRRVEVALAKELAEIDKLNVDDAQKETLRAKARANAIVDANNAATKVVLDEWQRTSDSINASLTDALLHGFEAGKSFGRNLRDTLVNMFKTLVLRPTISAVINPVAGALSSVVNGAVGGLIGVNPLAVGSAAANAGGIFGAGSSLDTIAGAFGFGSGVGGAAISGGEIAATVSSTADALAALGAGASEAATAAAALGESMAAGAAGTFGGGITAALSAIPVAGWLALAATAAAAIFGGQRGGPKSESSVNYFTQTADSTAAKGIADGVKAAITGVFGQLGVNSSVGDIGVHYAMDPQGTALTQFDLAVYQAGYSRGSRLGGTENVARGDEALQKAIAEETVRAIYAALRASDLEDKLKSWLDGLDINSSVDKLQARIDDVIAVKKVSAALAPLGGAFASLADQSVETTKALIEATGGYEALAAQASAYYENFFTQAEKEARVREQLSAALGAVGVTLPATREAYRALVEAQDITTESGRKTVAALLANAGAFAQLYPAAQAAADAVGDAVDSVSQIVDKARELIDRLKSASSSLESAKDALRNYRDSLANEVSSVQGQINELRGQALQAVKSASATVQGILAALSSAATEAQQAVDSAIGTARDSLGALAAANDAAQSALAQASTAVQDQLKSLQSANEQAQSQVESAAQALSSALAGVASAVQQTAQAVEAAQAQVSTARSNITEKYLAALDAEKAVKERVTEAYIAAQSEVTAAQQRLASLQEQAAAKLRSAGDSILSTLRDLQGGTAGSSNVIQRLVAQRGAFNALAARAFGGDADAASQLGAAGKSFLEASRSGSSSAGQFQSDDLLVRRTLAAVVAVTGSTGSSSTGSDAIAQAQADLEAALDKASAAQTLAIQSGASLVRSNENLAAEIATAALEVARWSSAVEAAGAARTQETADALAEYNSAVSNLAVAQDSQARLMAAIGDLDLNAAQQSADSWANAVDAARSAQQQQTAAQEAAGSAAARLQVALDAASAAGVELAATKEPLELLNDALDGLSDAQAAATDAAYQLQAGMAAAAELGIVMAATKTPLEALQGSLELVRTAQTNAATAAGNLTAALDSAALLGITAEAVVVPLSQLDDALKAVIDAQAEASAVDADLYTSSVGLVEQYGILNARLDTANDALADFAVATSGLDLSPIRSVLDGLVADYNASKVDFDAVNAQISLITAQLNATQAGHDIAQLYSELLGRTPDFDGLVYWFDKFAQGWTKEQVAAGIESSPEYRVRAGLPAYAVGTNYVPQDGPAYLHRGEMVVPRRFNPALIGAGDEGLRSEVTLLRTQLRTVLECIATNTNKSARTLDRVVQGDALQTTPA